MMNPTFWKGKKVFLTGHTGFKGAWLGLWLHNMGAKVTGFSLNPPTEPNLFDLINLKKHIPTVIGDVRNLELLVSACKKTNPDIVIHMAAQPLVRKSYLYPVETYETNVMGTIHLLEAVRITAAATGCLKAVLIVTSDKCYENKEWSWGYRENEPMGGYDPYSNSKGCAELITSGYRHSYFNALNYVSHGVAIATARAGNVIGGGDWAEDRLIPDFIRALSRGECITIRNPQALRPWQHVLEPLSGYLTLIEKLYSEGMAYAEGWNFGPLNNETRTVEWIVKSLCEKWGPDAAYRIEENNDFHEAYVLKLDCSKAFTHLGWEPKWDIEHSIDKIVEWLHEYKNESDMNIVCEKQIDEYSLSKSGDIL